MWKRKMRINWLICLLFFIVLLLNIFYGYWVLYPAFSFLVAPRINGTSFGNFIPVFETFLKVNEKILRWSILLTFLNGCWFFYFLKENNWKIIVLLEVFLFFILFILLANYGTLIDPFDVVTNMPKLREFLHVHFFLKFSSYPTFFFGPLFTNWNLELWKILLLYSFFFLFLPLFFWFFFVPFFF